MLQYCTVRSQPAVTCTATNAAQFYDVLLGIFMVLDRTTFSALLWINTSSYLSMSFVLLMVRAHYERILTLVAISFEGYSAQCSTATTVQYTALLSLSFFPSLSSPHNKLMDEERGGNETLAVSRGWRRRRGRRRRCCFPSTFPPLSFLLLLLHSRNELRGSGGGRLCLSLSLSSSSF